MLPLAEMQKKPRETDLYFYDEPHEKMEKVLGDAWPGVPSKNKYHAQWALKEIRARNKAYRADEYPGK